MRTRRGLTLLEVVIAAAVLAVVLAAIYATMSSTLDVQTSGTASSQIERSASIAFDTMVEEIRNCSAATLNVTNPTPYVTRIGFTPITGMNADGTPILGTPAVYTTRYDDPDATGPNAGVQEFDMAFEGDRNGHNTLDDNKNGITDEMRLVRRPPPQGVPGVEHILCHNVAESGLTAVLDSDGKLTITLSLVTVDGAGKLLTRQFTTRVTPRNP